MVEQNEDTPEEIIIMRAAIGFAITIIFIVATTVVILDAQTNGSIERLVSKGAHPLDAACSLKSVSNHICIHRAKAKAETPTKGISKQ